MVSRLLMIQFLEKNKKRKEKMAWHFAAWIIIHHLYCCVLHPNYN